MINFSLKICFVSNQKKLEMYALYETPYIVYIPISHTPVFLYTRDIIYYASRHYDCVHLKFTTYVNTVIFEFIYNK